MNLDTMGDLLISGLPLVTLGATYALTALGVYFTNKYRNNRLVQAIVLLDQVVIEVVKELNQTIVTGLKTAKADGKLTPDEARQVKNKAIELVQNRMGLGWVRLIQSALGPFGQVVGTKIEAAIFDSKTVKK